MNNTLRPTFAAMALAALLPVVSGNSVAANDPHSASSMPQGQQPARYLYIYHSTSQAPQLGYSMHYATHIDGELTALNFGNGVLFAPADWTTQENTPSPESIQSYTYGSASSYSYGGKRSLENAFMFRMQNGKIGVVAQVRAYDDALPMGYDQRFFFWTTENLLDFEYVGMFTPQSGQAVQRPQVENVNGAYHITWTTDGSTQREVRTTSAAFASFTDYATNWSRPRASAPIVPFGTGSCEFQITEGEYQHLLKKLTPVVNVGADPIPDSLTLPMGVGFSSASLPQHFTAHYSDGSAAQMPIKWDAAQVAAVDANAAGTYTIKGSAAYDQYPWTFINNRADPDIKFYNGHYYFISTYDATGGSPPNSYQRSLRISRSATLDGISTATESVILPENATYSTLKWAPELHEINGALCILFAMSPTAINSSGWDRQHAHIMTLKANGDPLAAGDWNAPATIKRPGGTEMLQADKRGITIDMTYVEDAGNHYYIWSQRLVDGPGTADLYIAKFNPSAPSVLTSTPVCLTRAMYGWDRPGSSRVDEGAHALKRNGRIFVTFSGAFVDSTYCVGLLEAASGSDLTVASNWKRTGYPILTSQSVAGQYGPGHNAYTQDEFGRDVFVFHARSSANASAGEPRHTGMRTVHWAFDGTPVLHMTPDQQLLPQYRTVSMTVRVVSSD